MANATTKGKYWVQHHSRLFREENIAASKVVLNRARFVHEFIHQEYSGLFPLIGIARFTEVKT